MGRDVFYITTPIYYPNDVPHIGHAYNAVATDFIARYHRLRGEEVFHLTGTDEHGLKLQRAAEAAGMAPQQWVDEMEPRWREVWARLDIAYDDYIRTTEPRHEAAVRKILQAVQDNGRDDIYLGHYEGLYCVSCELYYDESDLLLPGMLCPIHEHTPGPAAPDLSRLSAGTLGFLATGDPTDATRLTLTVIRDELSRITTERAAEDPNLSYLDGRELYGEADFAELPLPDQLHPDAAAHRRIGERFAQRLLGDGGPLAVREA